MRILSRKRDGQYAWKPFLTKNKASHANVILKVCIQAHTCVGTSDLEIPSHLIEFYYFNFD